MQWKLQKPQLGQLMMGFLVCKHLSSHCCGGVVAICHSTSPQNCQIYIHDNVIYFCLLHDFKINENFEFESIIIISYCVELISNILIQYQKKRLYKACSQHEGSGRSIVIC